MANRVLVGDVWFVVNDEYRSGAMTARTEGRPRRNERPGSPWSSGYRHEIAREHVRFGVDVVNARGVRRDFRHDPALPRVTDVYGNESVHTASYLLAFLEATGALEAARVICRRNDRRPKGWASLHADDVPVVMDRYGTWSFMKPGWLREDLERQGILLGVRAAAAVLRRLAFEKASEGIRPASSAMAGLSSSGLLFLSALGTVSEYGWDGTPTLAEVSKGAGKPPGWAGTVAMTLVAAGLGDLFRLGPEDDVELTPAGWGAWRATGAGRPVDPYGSHVPLTRRQPGGVIHAR